MKILGDMVKELGIRGMYTGTVATGMRDVPFSIVYFSLYGMSAYLFMRACMRASMHAQMHARTHAQMCANMHACMYQSLPTYTAPSISADALGSMKK